MMSCEGSLPRSIRGRRREDRVLCGTELSRKGKSNWKAGEVAEVAGEISEAVSIEPDHHGRIRDQA
jgi:hypothetical protein